MGSLRVLPVTVSDPFSQMALDEALFQIAISENQKPAILRFYHFDTDCVTLGFAQRKPPFIQSISSLALPWVRRPTGGGLVVHKGDLIFSMILPIEIHASFRTTRSAYQAIHLAIHEALLSLGVKTVLASGCRKQDYLPDQMICFERPICDDLLYQNQKVAGGAERWSSGFMLHQGSIQVGVLLADNQTHDDLAKAIAANIEKRFGWERREDVICSEELELAREFAIQKYRTDGWNREAKMNSEETSAGFTVHAKV